MQCAVSGVHCTEKSTQHAVHNMHSAGCNEVHILIHHAIWCSVHFIGALQITERGKSGDDWRRQQSSPTPKLIFLSPASSDCRHIRPYRGF